MFIYKITNKINGKVYIGKTVRTVEQRWAQHLADAHRRSSPLLHNAIRKYGSDAFNISILHEVSTLPELWRLRKQQTSNKGAAQC
jgi:group I intron endonuclease